MSMTRGIMRGKGVIHEVPRPDGTRGRYCCILFMSSSFSEFAISLNI
jgi:hypothetical protein